MSLVEWAREELARLVKDDDEMQKAINADVLEIIEVFAKQGHSDFSASYAVALLKRLLAGKPIQPLTGEDDEWEEVGSKGGVVVEQNKRYPAVFRKNKDNSTAYDIEGRVFSYDGGKTWVTNRRSHVPITFPYKVPDDPERIIFEG